MLRETFLRRKLAAEMLDARVISTESDDPRVLLAVERNLLHTAVLLGPFGLDGLGEQRRISSLDLVDGERVVVRRNGDITAIHLEEHQRNEHGFAQESRVQCWLR